MKHPFFYPIQGDQTTSPVSTIKDLIDLQVQQKVLDMLTPKKEDKKEEPKKDKLTFLQVYAIVCTVSFGLIWPGYMLLFLKIALAAGIK